MLNALKFVDRAAADKDIIPILTHICVHDGKLQGADSKMALETPCPELAGQSFTVPAEKFIKAVIACDGEPSIVKQDDGRVKVSHKRFKVLLPSLDVKNYPRSELKTDKSVQVPVPSNFLQQLKQVFPFISQDASRPWSLGVNLANGYAYATNNVSMVRIPCTWAGPVLNLPRFAVAELLDIDRSIKSIWVDSGAVSFEFDTGWFRAQIYTDMWPTQVAEMFNTTPIYEKIPEGLLKAINKLIPFCPDIKFPSIYFKDGCITTADGAQSAEIGFDWSGVGVYRAETLQLVLGVATEWAPSTFPKPVFFKAGEMDGMFVGIRQ